MKKKVKKHKLEPQLEIPFRNKIHNAVTHLKNMIKKVGLDVEKIEIIDIRPMVTESKTGLSNNINSVIRKSTQLQRAAKSTRVRYPRKKRNQFKRYLKRITRVCDYKVTLRWHIIPPKKAKIKKLSERKKVCKDITFSKSDTLKEESYMIYNARSGRIKFDTIASAIPAKIKTRYTSKKTIIHHSAIDNLGYKSIDVSNIFNWVLYKANFNIVVGCGSRIPYVTDSIRAPAGNFSFSLTFHCWLTGYILPPAIFPFCIVGENGSHWSSSGGPGLPWVSKITCTSGDKLVNLNADMKSAPTSGFLISASFSIYGQGVTITPLYPSHSQLTITKRSASEFALKHRTSCDIIWGLIYGMYFSQGSLVVKADVIETTVPGNERGYIRVRLPIRVGYYWWGLVAKMHSERWDYLDGSIEYTRGHSLKPAIITIAQDHTEIEQLESVNVSIRISNPNNYVDLEKVTVTLDLTSLRNLAFSTGNSFIEIRKIDRRDNEICTFTILGEKPGMFRPRFNIKCYYGPPVPGYDTNIKEQEYIVETDSPVKILETKITGILGKVLSSKSHESLSTATIKLEPTNMTTKSFPSGHFVLSDLESDVYTLAASLNGFKEMLKEVTVDEGIITKINIALDKILYIGNKNTKELHLPECSFLPSKKNIVEFTSKKFAKNFDGCGHCLRKFHTR